VAAAEHAGPVRWGERDALRIDVRTMITILSLVCVGLSASGIFIDPPTRVHYTYLTPCIES